MVPRRAAGSAGSRPAAAHPRRRRPPRGAAGRGPGRCGGASPPAGEPAGRAFQVTVPRSLTAGSEAELPVPTGRSARESKIKCRSASETPRFSVSGFPPGGRGGGVGSAGGRTAAVPGGTMASPPSRSGAPPAAEALVAARRCGLVAERRQLPSAAVARP